MKHIREEDLILFHYGEAEHPETVEEHLAACETCRSAHASLVKVLEAAGALEAPDRSEAYPGEVLARVQSELSRDRGAGWRAWLTTRRLAAASAVLVLVVAAFVAGMLRGGRTTHPPGAGAIPEGARERILLLAVASHLERSRMLLVELSHAEGNGGLDISEERERARVLTAANRVYRRSAAGGGDPAAAALLEELERILLEIGNGPSVLAGEEIEGMREFITSRGILVRIQVFGEGAAAKGRRPAGPPGVHGV